ncbi:MAG: four helix bundle protein [Candidatus Omnitrophica bacterium]|nr:four helix bundle protein [Candidatus Omnitrophota bacterium]
MIKTFRDLTAWKKSHELVLEIYKVTKDFPVEEKYGLISQIRRAAVSVPTNIVEGFKRKSKKDYAHFINIADGSLEEVKYLLILSSELGFLREELFIRLNSLCDEVGRILHGFHKSLVE